METEDVSRPIRTTHKKREVWTGHCTAGGATGAKACLTRNVPVTKDGRERPVVRPE